MQLPCGETFVIFLLVSAASSQFSAIGTVGGSDQWCATVANEAQGFTEGTCYRYFINERVTHDVAVTRCETVVQGNPGILAIIPNQFAQATLISYLLAPISDPATNLWFGAQSTILTEWRWSNTGQTLTEARFTNWDFAEPQMNVTDIKYCASVLITDVQLRWRASNCGEVKQFICEYPRSGYSEQAIPNMALDWYAARAECAREGGYLLDMTNIQKLPIWRKMLAIVAGSDRDPNVTGDGSLWLGLNRQTWMWDDNVDHQISWTNFSTVSLQQSRQQGCAYLSTSDYSWVVTNCSSNLDGMAVSYLCQFPRTTLTPTPPFSIPTAPSVRPTPTQTTTLQYILPPAPLTLTEKSPIVIAVIVLAIIALLVIVIAILLSCFGHIWLPKIRRRLGLAGGEYIIDERPGILYVDEAVSTASSQLGRPNAVPIRPPPIPTISGRDDDFSRFFASNSKEPVNEVSEILFAPAELYSFSMPKKGDKFRASVTSSSGSIDSNRLAGIIAGVPVVSTTPSKRPAPPPPKQSPQFAPSKQRPSSHSLPEPTTSNAPPAVKKQAPNTPIVGRV